jgi:hypothetical protein
MRVTAFMVLLLSGLAFAAPAPFPRDSSKKVKRVILPAGAVKWENIRTKNGMIVRVSCGKVMIEGKRLFYGDGKVAMEVEATNDGMEFIGTWGMVGPCRCGPTTSGGKRGFVIDGSHEAYPGMTWLLRPKCPTADKLKPGSIYVISRNVNFKTQDP